MSHTQEPWYYEYDNSDSASGGQWYNITDAKWKSLLWKPYNCSDMPIEENAKRIVACVNACAGIPTDMLEAMPSGPASLLPMYARLEQQRDELQATADRFAEIMADKDRQLIAVARQREDLLSAAIEARRALAHAALRNPMYKDEYDVIDKAIAKARGRK